MRVLVTGHLGYIGTVLTRTLAEAGHQVAGVDSDLYHGCDFAPPPEVPARLMDVRDLQAADLDGFEAVIHLAALSNDPVGDIDPACTDQINHLASVRLASLARDAGVRRFVFASSCSLYGAAGDDLELTEQAAMHPLTPYAVSKVQVEAALSSLAGERFTPIYLRNATAYGPSPRLRCDVMVNNLVAHACATGEVLIKSDGLPWRPLAHVEDLAAAAVAVLTAPRDAVHNEAFNTGRPGENYRVRDVAEMVRQAVPGSRVVYAPQAGPDRRCYRVDFSKLARRVPQFRPRWTVRRGIEQLYSAYRRIGIRPEDIEGPRYVRIRRLRRLLGEGRLDRDLRWTAAPAAPLPDGSNAGPACAAASGGGR